MIRGEMKPIKPFDGKPKPTSVAPPCCCSGVKPAAPQTAPLSFALEAPSPKMRFTA